MSDFRRSQLIEIVEKEFIGPDPIDFEGYKQENGEEILFSDPPRTRYIAGILFPQEVSEDESSEINEGELEDLELMNPDNEGEELPQSSGDSAEYLENAEELINRSNAYRQSAISITVAIKAGDMINMKVSAGKYSTISSTDSRTGKRISRYFRSPVEWDNDGCALVLPKTGEGLSTFPVKGENLQVDITYRYKRDNYSIYTFTLENTNVNGGLFSDDQCYFQTKFTLFSQNGFQALPDSQKINAADEDYKSNQLLYRDVRNYAIGHGCATDWDDGDKVTWISTATFPSFEVKPIVPATIPGVALEMLNYGPEAEFSKSIKELKLMCDRYEEWINARKEEINTFTTKYPGKNYEDTALRHIANCMDCLTRMRNGILLLEGNTLVRTAFQYMNLAMLMQQLHYNLPLQKWTESNDGKDLQLENPLAILPDAYNDSTWYDKEHKVYGKWRPFQLAFILMNLQSMADRHNPEREIVDLIWFPTGGGKTEAYLGLSAYTIFIRRLMNKDDAGTAILMRYTLRLLTAQQYERASSMICACDLIRKEHEDLFGKTRISIGLWVGVATTPNKIKDAVAKYDALKQGKSDVNPFVILKCPWCGAQMGVVSRGKEVKEIPGYERISGPKRQKKIIFRCSNTKNGCDFSQKDYPLPLYVVDEDIYNKRPTLLLGTVDKFAMLPFRPEAQGLFGYSDGEKITAPDLIIQDELHLISGPLGSMVGHYETMINELCAIQTDGKIIYPKIIASTATISRAKEQCHALYGCSRDKVFQFPPSGLSAGDSFFACEDKSRNGRKYVGILATGSSSDATTAIRLYASLLYAAKELDVVDEKLRDPYWTNIGYYNSIRELGQARTWIRADIDQHLDVIYKRRFYDKAYSKEEYRLRRRYIWRDEELTSRISGDKVTASLSNLNIRYPALADENGRVKDYPIDICLATNMISVGLDVPRLGLMTVAGQPKTTSEYIQATSRVGRDAGTAPGIVFVLYRPGRARDKSHYEHFKEYHSRLYCNVEPTSVTPFSAPVRERALHAIMVGMMRLEGDKAYNESKPTIPDKRIVDHIKSIIENRVENIDPEELDDTMERWNYILDCWEAWNPKYWEPKKNRDYSYTNDVPLMYAAGTHKNEAWGDRGIETPTSMRSVDASCEAEVLARKYVEKGDD